jgi:heptosyltransferase-2
MKTLIIKLGALGDVVRTTVLLRELGGEIHWLTRGNATDLLGSSKIKKVYFFEDGKDKEMMEKEEFDLIVSLDEEREILEFLKKLKTKRIIGIFLGKDGKINYSPDSKYWFDMSLSSRLGKEKADELKKINRKSVPQILIEMIGKNWSGQEYDIGISSKKSRGRIGLINVSTGTWPNKAWYGYNELAELLKKNKQDVIFLGMRQTLMEHINDINGCEAIVCGDTLGMHIALALKKKVIAIFNCTSPDEIYDYGRMIKIVSPLYEKCFYSKEFSREAIEAIKAQEVYEAVKKILKE